MKKILLLGASAQQVIVIDTTKRPVYSAVLCDFLLDNPFMAGEKFLGKLVMYKNTRKGRSFL